MKKENKYEHKNAVKQKEVICGDGKKCTVYLENVGAMYFVNVDDECYYKGANALMAIQKYNEV